MSNTIDDDIISKTFGEDTVMSTSTVTEDASGTKETTKVVKKKTNTNTVLFLGIGIAILFSLLYLFLLKPMMTKPRVVQKSEPAIEQQVENTAPSVAPSQVASNAQTAENKQAQDYLTGQSVQQPSMPSVIPMPQQATTVTVDPASGSVSVAGQGPSTVTVPTTPNAPIAVQTNEAQAVVAQLSDGFDQQLNQFRQTVDSVGNRVSELERFKSEQLNTNSSFDRRITTLENNSSTSNVSSNNNSSPRKIVRKPVRVQKKTKIIHNSSSRKVEPREEIIQEKVVNQRTTIVNEKVPTSIENNIHSVYGGRIWLKNNDSSLTTYSAGDRLPNGEVIKSIDDESFSVTTDKRVYRKK